MAGKPHAMDRSVLIPLSILAIGLGLGLLWFVAPKISSLRLSAGVVLAGMLIVISGFAVFVRSANTAEDDGFQRMQAELERVGAAELAIYERTGSFTAEPTELEAELDDEGELPEYLLLSLDSDGTLVASTRNAGSYMALVMEEGRLVAAPCGSDRCESGRWQPEI